MTEWKEYKLGEIAEVITGYPFPGDKYESTGNLRVVRGENVTIGNLRWDTEKHWNHETEGLEKYFLQSGDIVIGMDGSRVGDNRAKVKQVDLPLILAQRVACLRAKKEFSQGYLWYTIFSDNFKKYVEAIHTGTSIPHISQKQIEDFEILCPPLETQRRIAAILSSLDDKIDLLHRENATLEQMAETLFRQWFVVEAKEEWEEGKLGDICNYVTEKIDIGNVEIVDYISTENMCSNKQGVVQASSVPETGKATKYRIDDVLLSNIRPYFKKIWLADKEGGCSADVLCIRSKNELYKFFTYYTVRQDEFFDYVMLGSKGCKMPRGDKSHIMNWSIMIPQKETLLKFNKFVANGIEKIRSNNNQIRTLIETRDGLLPRLMSGEVKI